MRRNELIVNLVFLFGPVVIGLFIVLLLEIVGCLK
jgi:hypothetical protein